MADDKKGKGGGEKKDGGGGGGGGGGMPPDVKKFIVYGIGALVLYFILLSHGWIPEGRYATTSGTHRSFQTPSQQRGGVVGETGRTCTGPSGQVYKCDSYTGQCVCP